MTATPMTFSAEFHAGFRATLTISMQGIHCEWTPDLPRSLKPKKRAALLGSYRTWRDECVTEFARAHGLRLHTVRILGIDCLMLCQPEESQP